SSLFSLLLSSSHMTSLSDDNLSPWEDHCSVIPPERSRLYLIGLGSVVASFSVLSNLFLFIVLIRTRRHLNSPFLYLISLSLADIFLSGAYILLFLVNMLMDEWESSLLSSFWWSYMPYVLVLSHLAITASAFLIVAAAAERYVTISKMSSEFSTSQRLSIVFIAFSIAIVGKLPMAFEVEVVKNDNCTGVTEWTADVAQFSNDEPYASMYKFWFRNLVTVMLPFALLLCLNVAIIRRLHRQHQSAKLFRFGTSTHRRNVRSATLSLICVTCTYLASNLLNVVLNLTEFIDRNFLYEEDVRPLYTMSSDLVSFFTVGASAFRLPIYYVCNAKIKSEVHRFINEFNVFSNCRKLGVRNSHSSTVKYPLSTVRYCNTGNGFVVFESRGSAQLPRRVGTRLDRLVLAVALGSVARADTNPFP
ncbi:hypothetical protein PFISCL1PPCAC_6044, partial [Pristionchus fissidentatus]